MSCYIILIPFIFIRQCPCLLCTTFRYALRSGTNTYNVLGYLRNSGLAPYVSLKFRTGHVWHKNMLRVMGRIMDPEPWNNVVGHIRQLRDEIWGLGFHPIHVRVRVSPLLIFVPPDYATLRDVVAPHAHTYAPLRKTQQNWTCQGANTNQRQLAQIVRCEIRFLFHNSAYGRQ